MYRCVSTSYMWMVSLFSYHGLMLLYGALIAWNTRKISMSLMNDAKAIAMTIYTCTVLSIIGAPVSILVNGDHNLNYGISEFCVIFATTILLLFCFVPKVLYGCTSRLTLSPFVVGLFLGTPQPEVHRGQPCFFCLSEHLDLIYIEGSHVLSVYRNTSMKYIGATMFCLFIGTP